MVKLRQLKPVLICQDAWELVTGKRSWLIPPTRLMHEGIMDYDDFRQNGETFLEKFIEYANLKPEDKVLDVGCGIGRKALGMTPYIKSPGSYEGFDIVPAGVNWCQKRISKRYPHFQFQHLDVYNFYYNPSGKMSSQDVRFPYPDASFDFVLLGSVFTHMLTPDVERYFSEIERVLKVGGRAFISYFIWNDHAEEGIKNGTSACRIPFVVDEHSFSADEEPREGLICYKESYLRDLYKRHGLDKQMKVHYGDWSEGGSVSLNTDFQDIIVTTKTAS